MVQCLHTMCRVSDPSTEKGRVGGEREEGSGVEKENERNGQVVSTVLVRRVEVCIPNIVLLILLTFWSGSRKVDSL